MDRFRKLYSLSNESLLRKSFHYAIDGLITHLLNSGHEVIAWTMSHLDNGFIQLFKANDPMATIIMIYYAVLLHALKERWWARSMGRQLVAGLSALMNKATLSSAMLESLEWAQDEVSMSLYPP